MTAASPHPVQAAREAQGLSREGLAFKAGVSLKTVERIESGQAVPRRATLAMVALALGVDPADLTVEQAA